jgi:transposase-like protein
MAKEIPMTHERGEIHRKKRIVEYAERMGNVRNTYRCFGVARSTFYLWRDRYRELAEAGLISRMGGSHKHPSKTPDELVEEILHSRRTQLKRKKGAPVRRYQHVDTAS